VALLGSINGVNQTFTTPEDFLNNTTHTLSLFYNGQRLFPGAGNDFLLSESGGFGTGWDTVQTTFAPRAGDRLTADYSVP
jgi:hypothetical protein